MSFQDHPAVVPVLVCNRTCTPLRWEGGVADLVAVLFVLGGRVQRFRGSLGVLGCQLPITFPQGGGAHHVKVLKGSQARISEDPNPQAHL